MKWRDVIIFLLVIACAVLGCLWWHERGKVDTSEADRQTRRADSLEVVAHGWKERGDTLASIADTLRTWAESIIAQDTVNLETYLNERKKLPAADAARLKRIILWRNERPR